MSTPCTTLFFIYTTTFSRDPILFSWLNRTLSFLELLHWQVSISLLSLGPFSTVNHKMKIGFSLFLRNFENSFTPSTNLINVNAKFLCTSDHLLSNLRPSGQSFNKTFRFPLENNVSDLITILSSFFISLLVVFN